MCVVALAGCGSGGGNTHSAARTQLTSPAADGQGGASTSRNRAGARAGHGSAQVRGRGLSPAQRIALARGAARSVLMQVGFSEAAIDVGGEGRTVAIAIPAGSACTASPGDETRIVHQLEQVAPFLSRVTVGVAGSGQSLSSYATARCPSSALPSAPGRVAYHQTGRGFATTGSFAVHSPRWTIDFENDGAFFAVFVLRSGKPLPRVITETQRSAGSKTFSGPGSFRLRISGSGRWTIRVRDGA
jgi:hypothetical protein